GLAGDRGHPGPDNDAEIGDHTEVAYRELEKHQPSYRSASPNLVLRMRWKLRGPSVTSRASGAPARQVTASPCCSMPISTPSIVSAAGRSSMTSTRTCSAASSTRLR